jgi:amino acid transporter
VFFRLVSSSTKIFKADYALDEDGNANCLSQASTVLEGAGSVGLSLFYWVIGFFMAASMLSVYMEFVSYFPSRSGSEVVYLEQAYPRPRYFFPTVFAMQTVLFSFSSSNAVGMMLVSSQ